MVVDLSLLPLFKSHTRKIIAGNPSKDEETFPQFYVYHFILTNCLSLRQHGGIIAVIPHLLHGSKKIISLLKKGL